MQPSDFFSGDAMQDNWTINGLSFSLSGGSIVCDDLPSVELSRLGSSLIDVIDTEPVEWGVNWSARGTVDMKRAAFTAHAIEAAATLANLLTNRNWKPSRPATLPPAKDYNAQAAVKRLSMLTNGSFRLSHIRGEHAVHDRVAVTEDLSGMPVHASEATVTAMTMALYDAAGISSDLSIRAKEVAFIEWAKRIEAHTEEPPK